MDTSRRSFLRASAIATGAALAPWPLRAQARPRYADMHAHMNVRGGPQSFREFMARGNMLLVAEKAVPDGPLLRYVNDRVMPTREAQPGELRKYFENQSRRMRERARAEGLAIVTSAQSLDRVVAEGTPALACASEGADFLEGDLGYLQQARAEGLVHTQLVHYRISDIGDIATENPRQGGLTAFGKDVLRACNKLGILVDVAHCTSAGIEQALELSSKPVVHSHGFVSRDAPSASQGGVLARAIHAPLAKRLTERGGVIGLQPVPLLYQNLEIFANELARLAEAYGAGHVGIGTDMIGLARSTLPSYAEYPLLPDLLAKRGMKPDEIDAVLGGNYVRVLREALTV